MGNFIVWYKAELVEAMILSQWRTGRSEWTPVKALG